MKKCPTTKILLFATIISISLIAGYFCFMPQMMQATATAGQIISIPTMDNMTDCGQTITNAHFMISKADSNSIAPCCLAKKDNPQSSAIILTTFSPKENVQQNTSIDLIDANNFSGHSIPQKISTSPTQTKLLASVIKIE